MVTAAELVNPANGAVARPASVGQATAVEQARAVAEVLAAVQVAQACPRDMQRAWEEMRSACSRKALADEAFYSVVNRGTGPSVHLARELARIWGNVDYGVRELRRDDNAGESEVQAFAWDQQTNTRTTRSMIHPHVRMKRKDGKQVREALVDITDIYLSNQNLGARAVRECIFAILPRDFVTEAQDICRRTIEKGDGKPLETRIAEMVDGYKALGVTTAQIEGRLGRKRGQWTAADVADLGVLYRSIQRRETTVDAEFPAPATTSAELVAKAKPARPEPIDTGGADPVGDPPLDPAEAQ